VSAKAEIVALDAPVADAALEQLAAVLVDCVEGGASVNFMSPFSQDQALAFFRKVAGSVAAGDTVLLAARLDSKIVGTVQLGLDTPPNQPHRADIKKMLVHRAARGRGIGAALMAEVEEEARRRGRWLLVLDTVPGEKRPPPLFPRGLDADRPGAGLRAVSRRPAVRHRDHVETAEAVVRALGRALLQSRPPQAGQLENQLKAA
jgi:L-amino acid N-acyltransferase YncA